MSLTLQQHDSTCLLQLDGRITIASAIELKQLLVEWLASGKDLDLNLSGAEEIDITTMQLLWTAAREATRAGVSMTVRASEAASNAVRSAGFSEIPGFPVA